jgi:hypothetical protein
MFLVVMFLVVPVVMVVMGIAPVVTAIVLRVVVAVVMPPVTMMPLVMLLHGLCGRSRCCGCRSGGRRLACRVGRARSRGLKGKQGKHQGGEEETGNKFPDRHRDSFM